MDRLPIALSAMLAVVLDFRRMVVLRRILQRATSTLLQSGHAHRGKVVRWDILPCCLSDSVEINYLQPPVAYARAVEGNLGTNLIPRRQTDASPTAFR
jgi:hypothetical protein